MGFLCCVYNNRGLCFKNVYSMSFLCFLESLIQRKLQMFKATISKSSDDARKHRDVPHPELYFLKVCNYYGSEYVDSDVFS